MKRHIWYLEEQDTFVFLTEMCMFKCAISRRRVAGKLSRYLHCSIAARSSNTNLLYKVPHVTSSFHTQQLIDKIIRADIDLLP